MSWYARFKNYLYRRSINSDTAQQNRLGIIKNYANSRYIGIWFDATDRENFKLTDNYAYKLAAKGKKVEILGFVKKVRKDEDIPFEHIAPKEVNWYGVPSEATKKTWAEKPYDILLCLHTKECKPLEYMAQLSAAKCKVGRYSENTVECYDLMVSLSEDKGLEQMIKQVDQLLNDINKNQTQNATAV